MKLEYNEQELELLMKDFHTLTGIRIVLFDREYNELISYPRQNCAFCQKMKDMPHTNRLCNQSDQDSFRKCQKKNELIIYHCHAGLIEATAPLIHENMVIGYMMFGQISDVPNDNDIPLKSNEEIRAAAKIMEACTFYAVFKDTIHVRRSNFIRNMDQYLTDHLSEDLSVNRLASQFGISKTKLYQTYEQYYGCGIAEHVRYIRMEKAKELLKETAEPITTISDLVGFTDYNYFCRVFKKEVGIPAKKYRQQQE